jgi:hypothetical protein
MEVAARKRLTIVLPTLDITHPISIQEFFTFSDNCELIEQWSLIYRESLRKFGYSTSANELRAAIFKTIKARKASTPYIKGILVDKPRFYSIGRILPIKLKDSFSTNLLIREEFRKNICGSPDNRSMCNIELLRLSFPDTLKELQSELDNSINCLEDLD